MNIKEVKKLIEKYMQFTMSFINYDEMSGDYVYKIQIESKVLNEHPTIHDEENYFFSVFASDGHIEVLTEIDGERSYSPPYRVYDIYGSSPHDAFKAIVNMNINTWGIDDNCRDWVNGNQLKTE